MYNLLEYYKVLKMNYDGADDSFQFVIDNLRSSTPFAFARFNDGEMMGVEKIGAIAARGDQFVNRELHQALVEAMKFKMRHYYVGIPCSICFPNYNRMAIEIVGDYQYRKSAVTFHNRNWPKFISIFSSSLQGKRIRYVSGEDQDLTFLEKHMGLKIIDHQKFQRIDSWAIKDRILNYGAEVMPEDVVLISLGPTARILARKWFQDFPLSSYIDIGSIFDPFTRNIWHNYHKGWENRFNIGKRCPECN